MKIYTIIQQKCTTNYFSTLFSILKKVFFFEIALSMMDSYFFASMYEIYTIIEQKCITNFFSSSPLLYIQERFFFLESAFYDIDSYLFLPSCWGHVTSQIHNDNHLCRHSNISSRLMALLEDTIGLYLGLNWHHLVDCFCHWWCKKVGVAGLVLWDQLKAQNHVEKVVCLVYIKAKFLIWNTRSVKRNITFSERRSLKFTSSELIIFGYWWAILLYVLGKEFYS